MKLILFDVDGTLVDSQNLIVEAQGLAFSALGLPAPSREKALSIVGLSHSENRQIFGVAAVFLAACIVLYLRHARRCRRRMAAHQAALDALVEREAAPRAS